MTVVEASVMGFCGGVRRAMRIAAEAAAEARRLSLPCYVYGDIVHSRAAMDELHRLGIVRIANADVPPGIVIIRTHGIPDALRSVFEKGGFSIVDATCPVVLANQRAAREAAAPVLLIGKRGHAEMVSLLGARSDAVLIERPGDLARLSPDARYTAVVQTTLPLPLMEAIRSEAARLHLRIEEVNTVCRASWERRAALEELASRAEAIIVAGDACSANSAELRDLAERLGRRAFLVSSPFDVPQEAFDYGIIGLTAGASAPDTLIESIRRRLKDGR